MNWRQTTARAALYALLAVPLAALVAAGAWLGRLACG